MGLTQLCKASASNAAVVALLLALVLAWSGLRENSRSDGVTLVACNGNARPCRSWCQVGIPLLRTRCGHNRSSSHADASRFTVQSPACLAEARQEQTWSSLNSMGFSIRHAVFSKLELLELKDLLHISSQTIADYGDERELPVAEFPKPLQTKLMALAKEASATVGIDDMIMDSASFFIVDPSDRRNNQHRLHQDHASYYWGEDHIHYLNLYIAIEKSEDDANLDIIPFEKLSHCSDDLLAVQENGGAVRFMHRQESSRHFVNAPALAETILIDDSSGCNLAIDFPLESLICSAILRAGDILVMRGDLIHRTGNFFQRRIALSVRVRDGGLMIRAEQLLSMGLIKARYIKDSLEDHIRVLGYLAAHNLPHISLADLHRAPPYKCFSACSSMFSSAQCRAHAKAFAWTWYYYAYFHWRAWRLEWEAKLFPAY